MHSLKLVLDAQFLALALPLNSKLLIFELHVVQVLNCLLSGSRIDILKEAESLVETRVMRVFLEHEPPQLSEGLT